MRCTNDLFQAMQTCMLANLLMPSSDWTIKTFQSFQNEHKMGEAG